jgi:uncharacterized protein (TIGR02646 family)
LKRIYKSLAPNPLTAYAQQNPTADWDNGFRSSNGGNDYKAVRALMVDEQGGLCAYCETEIKNLPEHHKQVEHYHDKSHRIAANGHNWALDWNNVFAVCPGGSRIDEEEKRNYPLPDNLSCDAHKNHLKLKSSVYVPPEGRVLNPLDMVASPCLFSLNRANGELMPNLENCAGVEIKYNMHATVEELVEHTIKVFNLNCARLTAQRVQYIYARERAVKVARNLNNPAALDSLVSQWFSNRWPAFFTTRRILLGEQAERYLASMQYVG